MYVHLYIHMSVVRKFCFFTDTNISQIHMYIDNVMNTFITNDPFYSYLWVMLIIFRNWFFYKSNIIHQFNSACKEC